jgi:MFS family permease
LHTGVAYVIFGLGFLVGIGAASQMLPRTGVRPSLVGGMTLAAGGFALLTRLGLHLDYWSQLAPAQILTSVGLGLAFVSLTVAAVSEANDADAGIASGVVTTAQQVGGALGLAVLVSIATTRTSSRRGSGHAPAVAQLGRSHLAFGVGACVLAVGAVLAAVLIGRFKPTTMPAPAPIAQAAYQVDAEVEALAS